MRGVPEYSATRQGRPQARETIDLETRQSSLYRNYTLYVGEYDRMEKELTEQTHKLEELILEARKMVLALGFMLGQEVSSDELD